MPTLDLTSALDLALYLDIPATASGTLLGAPGSSGAVPHGGFLRLAGTEVAPIRCEVTSRSDPSTAVRLSQAWNRTFQDVYNEVGTGSLCYDGYMMSVLAPDDPNWDDGAFGPGNPLWLDSIVRVFVNERCVFAWVIDEIEVDTVGGDDEGGVVATLSGPGLADILSEAVVYPTWDLTGPPGQTTRTFTNATPGTVVQVLVDEAITRGCFPELGIQFDDIHDSGGNAWDIVSEISFPVGTDLLSVLRQLSATWIDFAMLPSEPRLRLWKRGYRLNDHVAPEFTTIGDNANLLGLHHQYKR